MIALPIACPRSRNGQRAFLRMLQRRREETAAAVARAAGEIAFHKSREVAAVEEARVNVERQRTLAEEARVDVERARADRAHTSLMQRALDGGSGELTPEELEAEEQEALGVLADIKRDMEADEAKGSGQEGNG